MSALAGAAGFRHGIVLPPQLVLRGASDPPGLVNVAVPSSSGARWRSAAGGMGRTREVAEQAALGEALERYAAAACRVPECTKTGLRWPIISLEEFVAYSEIAPEGEYDGTYTSAYSAFDNEEAWVPTELVVLRPGGLGVTTSSGLAAGRSPIAALLRAVQELVERDALVVTWAHGIAGRRVRLPEHYEAPVLELGGAVSCVDATSELSPHPVALVAGWIPLRRRPRYSLGAACSATWSQAVEKAYLEWLQGVSFVGTYCVLNAETLPRSADDVRTFDDHAVFYAANPGLWEEVPLLAGELVPAPPERPVEREAEQLADLLFALRDAAVRVFYRELTTPDLRQLGVSVVRALSPDLAPLWGDHRRRFLAGPVLDVLRRYPWASAQELRFPSPLPHPLG